MKGMLLRWRLKSILANDITFPMVYNLFGLHKTTQHFFACLTVAFSMQMRSLLHFGKNSSWDFMTKKMTFYKKSILQCLHLNRGLSSEKFQWISLLSEYFGGRQWKHSWQHNRGHFQWCDPILYWWASKLILKILYYYSVAYAYKQGASLLFNNK